MANKKNIKVRDLKPNKDAKGGGGVHALGHTGPSHAAGSTGPSHAAGSTGPSHAAGSTGPKSGF